MTDRILAMTTTTNSNVADCLAWKPTNDGVFTISSAYESIQLPDVHPFKKLSIAVWKWRGPERVRGFLWKAIQGALLTNECRKRRGLAASDNCLFCPNLVESLFHVFRDCYHTKEAWQNLLGAGVSNFFHIQHWQEWLYANLSSSETVQGISWSMWFGVMLDMIWWRRNESIFNQRVCSPMELVHCVRRMVEAIYTSLESTARVLSSSETDSSDIMVRWIMPNPGEVALNSDGSVTDAGLNAACGGVLRDDDDSFIFDYTAKIGTCSILAAEL